MITFAMFGTASLAVILLPCLFANVLLNLRMTSRQRATTPIGLTTKMA